MLTFFRRFFLTLGVIFFCLLLTLGYLYIADPWHLKPLFFNGPITVTEKTVLENGAVDSSATSTMTTATDSASGTDKGVTDEHPNLTASQEDALKLIGIDPAVLPESLTAEQEACFVEKLGETRVQEIKTGASPSAIDMFKANGCI